MSSTEWCGHAKVVNGRVWYCVRRRHALPLFKRLLLTAHPESVSEHYFQTADQMAPAVIEGLGLRRQRA